MKALYNGMLLLEDKVVSGYALLFEETISALVPEAEAKALAAEGKVEAFDAQEAYISPGFINVHVHGCGGADTMDGTVAALQTMSKAQAAMGVTSFLPTTMTYDWTTLARALESVLTLLAHPQEVPGAGILGCHMEGPFINEAHKGAQAAQNICQADFAKIAPYADFVKVVTLAPEVLLRQGPAGKQKLAEFCQACQEHGIIVSLGHSDATYEEAKEAFELGAGHITHLYNAMTGLHHRNPGLVGAALDSSAGIMAEMICDNIHSHPAAQRLAYKLKGAEGLELITDSIRACGLGDGTSELGGQQVLVQNGKATLADGTIAGSVLTMDTALRNFQKNTGAPLPEVVRLVTINPARELGLGDTLGRLQKHYKADIVVFDEGFKIKRTFVGGRQVFAK